MPTYDFACKTCGYQFSMFTTISGKKQVQCPDCGSADVTQRFTGFLYAKQGDSSGSGNGSECSGSCGSCSGC